MLMNCIEYPLPSNIFCVSNNVFNVKYFKKSNLSDSLINKLMTKKHKGISAPNVNEFFELLNIQKEQKHMLMITR